MKQSMKQSNGGQIAMDMEKIYLTMKRTGAGNIVLGIYPFVLVLHQESC